MLAPQGAAVLALFYHARQGFSVHTEGTSAQSRRAGLADRVTCKARALRLLNGTPTPY